MNSRASEEYWNHVALEAKDSETLRINRWKNAAKNWLAEYADKRANDFVLNVVENVAGLESSARVLDVGCGPGKWTKFFAKRCSKVTAIDVSSEMVRLARASMAMENLANVDFHVMSVSDLSLPNDAYDLVNCVTVLQHILDEDEWKRAIEKMVRVTKLGGKILLFETAPEFAIMRRTSHLRITSMAQYINEFRRARANLVYWRATDLSLPITFFGLKNYAASFNRRVYYFFVGRTPRFLINSFSLLSRIASLLAKPIDYRLGKTPLGYLSFGRIMLFEKNA